MQNLTMLQQAVTQAKEAFNAARTRLETAETAYQRALSGQSGAQFRAVDARVTRHSAGSSTALTLTDC